MKTGIAFGVGGVFLLVGGSFLLFGLLFAGLGLLLNGAGLESENWPTVEGTITVSRVRSYEDSDQNTMYEADVEYDYIAKDRRLTGNRITAIAVANSSRRVIEDLIAPYPVGSAVTVYYDPDNPERSVLETGGGEFSWVFVAFGGFFAALGAVIALAGVIFGVIIARAGPKNVATT